jgi:DNA polymerase III epsilon subunit-like protein
MIIVDIETSGSFDPVNNGIWQIGAVEFGNPGNTFLQESRIDDTDKIESAALKIIGKTESELRDKTKQSQKDLLQNFFSWAVETNTKTLIAHNTPFDYGFLAVKAKQYGLKFPFDYKSFDLHVFASLIYFQFHNEFPIEEGKSKMSLSNIMKFCGLQDNRIQLDDKGEVSRKGVPHNALEDAKIEAECLSRLLHGKNMFREFANSPIPDYLKKS